MKSTTAEPDNATDGETEKLKHKTLLKKSIHRALAEGLINDETLAYIRALGYARHRNPNDPRIQEAIRETLYAIQTIYDPQMTHHFSKEEQKYNARLAKEKLGEGVVENFSSGERERLIVTVPSRIIKHLEKQRILLIPLEIKTSTIAEAGKQRSFQYRLKGQENSRQMYALNEHWIGLYFHTDPQKVAKGQQEMQVFLNPANPITVQTTAFTFADTNLRGTNIDLFYPGLMHQLNADRASGDTSILYFNLTFKNCWVKNMNLQFWRYIANFPGTIAISFEDCDDFDEAYFPYLKKEFDGPRYYLDLEKFAEEVRGISSKRFLHYIDNILRFSANYKMEHLR